MQEKPRGGLFGCLSKTRDSVTKLDGTTKGGIAIAIAEKHGLPIRCIGVGEAMENLPPFNAQEFARALLPEKLGETSTEQA